MVVRRRLIFWLIRAYVAKWGKTIFFSFLAGLVVFFVLIFSSQYFTNFIPAYTHQVIGVAGAYTIDTLPKFVVENLSRGLTKVDAKGEIQPDIAKSWEIKDSGKTYIFYLEKDQYLTDGQNITSDLINYKFADVSVERPDEYTIVFKLKDAYAPFLITVSRPIFHTGFVGAGKYKIDDITLNGNFVQTMTVKGVGENKNMSLTYQFYPSAEALKYAYLLGEVNKVVGLENINIKNQTYQEFNNTVVNKKVNYKKLVTLFYNNNDNLLSDKKIRSALSYALPNDYKTGEKAFLPYSPTSVFYSTDVEDKEQNFEHARLLLDAAESATSSADANGDLNVSLKTLPKYKSVAEEIANNFAKIGINTSIEEVERLPADFQMYLGDFALSDDPDQYPLWHSGQSTNITKYKNLRIDKILEDGRKTIDLTERKKLYADFQRFLIEDVPVSFLFFPVEYELERRRVI